MVKNTLIVAAGDVCHHRVKYVHLLVLYSKMFYCFWKSNSVLDSKGMSGVTKCSTLLHGQLYKGVLCLFGSIFIFSLPFKIKQQTPFHMSRLL